MDAATRSRNQQNLKRVDSGGTIHYIHTRQDILIGDGHNAALVQAMKKANHYTGTITVKREKLIGKGKLYCQGSPANRSEFEHEMARISKKEVVWGPPPRS